MLTNRSILITGAAGGIGAATAVAMAEAGAAHVTLADKDPHGLAATAARLQSTGVACHTLEVDLRDSSEVNQMVDACAAWAGGIDVLINNAGVFDPMFASPEDATLTRLPESAWDAVFEVNTKAPWLAMKHAAPHLRRSSKTPSVVNVSSVAGLLGYGPPAYSASKGAVIQLTRSAAVNLAPVVRVNCVCPGMISTPMSDQHGRNRPVADRAHLIPRLGEPIEVARVIAFLAVSDASFMTGAIVPVDGGTTAWRGLRG